MANERQTAAQQAVAALRKMRKRDLVSVLAQLMDEDPRAREWLASELLGVKGAGELLGVERTRVWRYERSGKIAPVAELDATKVFLRTQLERFKRENPPQTRRRRGEAEAEAE